MLFCAGRPSGMGGLRRTPSGFTGHEGAQRHAGGAETRRHQGRVAVAVRNTRWCSDGLEIAAENGERVRVAFALDCCDREAMSYVATTAGITGEDVRDLMVAAVEHRFGPVNQLPSLIEWLTDNGCCYVVCDTRCFARKLGLIPKTTPLKSRQSNGMAEAFVRTLKRDYVRVSVLPDAQSVLRQLPVWLRELTERSLLRTARISSWPTISPCRLPSVSNRP